MDDDRERTLDDEGIPDLEGPLPEKAATGDPQEGMPPPNDEAQGSVDWGVTPAEERQGEPVGVRVAREEPEDEEDRYVTTRASPGIRPAGHARRHGKGPDRGRGTGRRRA